MSADQLPLFEPPTRSPSGFRYAEDVISPAEEQRLLAAFADLPFAPYEFRGFTGKRRIASFGGRYDFSSQARRADEIPEFLLGLRETAAAFAGLAPGRLAHAMVSDYPPGAPIGWHRDRPQFGEIVGVSLGSSARFRFRRRSDAGFERIDQELAPRSAYLISGEARDLWEHSIPPGVDQRFSVTFRTLRP